VYDHEAGHLHRMKNFAFQGDCTVWAYPARGCNSAVPLHITKANVVPEIISLPKG